MDSDGTKNGYDLVITELIANEVNVPVIASGGAGKLEHIIDVFQQTKAEAALLASLLHYGELTISQIKNALKQNNIPVRNIIN